ncbi:MAG: hypothetical protein IK094_08645, partial [Treponema sp.]|nr:hypothetical protein [Treponema sp.]
MPAIGQKSAANGVSKSAIPGMDQLDDTKYSFSATLEAAGTGGATYTADGTYDPAGTCDFAFAGARSDSDQNFTFTINLYYTDASVTKALIASGSQSITVLANAADFTANITLLPNASSTINGSMELPITFSDTSLTSVSVALLSGGVDKAAEYLGGSTVSLSGGAGTIQSVSAGLPAGTYTLLMTFLKGSAQVGSRTETINVFPGLKTSAWWTNGAAGTTLSVDAYNQTEFWVKGTGGKFYSEVYTASTEAKDTNVGSFAAPLATVQAAVDKINATGNTTTQYTVYIDGKVTGDADAVYSNYALVHLNKERKILFKGWSGPDTDIIDVNKKKTDTGPATQGHAFYVITSSPITLQNLGIVNATGSGGGVSSHGGALTVSRTGADVTVLDCKISDCWDYSGGAISVMLGSVKVKNSVLTKNKASTGGAIYVNGTSSFVTIEDSEIYGNTADSGSGGQGGGVYVTSGGTLYFKSGIIGSDDASKGNNAKAVGGGVFVNGSSTSSGKFYMSGSARIAGNSAKNTAGTEGYGGGVYVASGGIFCMSGSAIVGQKKTGAASAATSTDGERSNYAPTNGGGVYIIQPDGLKLGYKDETTPDPTFDGGIYYNYANSGGGIYASFDSAGGALEIERGSVCYNGAGGDGGGILGSGTTYASEVKMSGGEVSCNSSGGSGGGIAAKTVYVGGGTIAGNTASSYGGGVYASSDFYLYGSGVIGDTSKAEIAKEDDCSNKAKAGGGVYSHKVYIGYSAASTPAACTGGIYRNYATAVKGSETYFYGGGGICVRGTNAYWLFKMQSGTVAYNAGDSSDGYGGGLFIYGSGAVDSSIVYPQVTGGSFVGNGAKYGGALCCYDESFA